MLYSSMEMYQLIKIGTLIQHFSKHQREDQTSTFLGLLIQHYTPNSTEENDPDKTDDMKLPFKSCMSQDLSPFVISEVFIQANTQTHTPDISYGLPSNDGYNNIFSPYIFKPPNTRVKY